ncbi:hypothetical protein ABPG74_018715 [Tetrahymena malaccensis]
MQIASKVPHLLYCLILQRFIFFQTIIEFKICLGQVSQLEQLLINQGIKYISKQNVLNLEKINKLVLNINLNNTNVTQVLQICQASNIQLNFSAENVNIFAQQEQKEAFINICGNATSLVINKIILKNVNSNVNILNSTLNKCTECKIQSIKLQNLACSKPIFILGSINSFGISNLESDSLSIFQSKLPLFQVDIQANEGYLTFSSFEIPTRGIIKSDKITFDGYTGNIEDSVTTQDEQSQIQLEKEQRTLILISKQSKGFILISQMNIDLQNRNIRFLTSFDWINSKIYIRDSYFYRNKAIQDGGSIYLKQIAPLVTLYNTTFDSCSSGNFGGALYVYQLNATNCTFINNKSKIGGVLFTVIRESNILNSQYINNSASIISPNNYICPSYVQDRDNISCEIFQIENIFEYNQQLQNTPLYIKEIYYTLQADNNLKNALKLQAKLMYGIVYIIKLRLHNINFTQYSSQLYFGNVYSYLAQNYQQYFSPFSVPDVFYPYLVITYVPNLDCQNTNQLIRFDFFQSSFYTPGCFEVSSSCNPGMQQLTSINQEQIFQQCQYCNLGQFLYKTNYTCLTCNPNYYSSCYSNLTYLANGFWRNELTEDENSIYQCNLNPSNCESENRIGVGNSLCKEGYKGDQCLACDLDGQVWGESYGGTGNKLYQIILSNSLHKNPFIQLLDIPLRILFH